MKHLYVFYVLFFLGSISSLTKLHAQSSLTKIEQSHIYGDWNGGYPVEEELQDVIILPDGGHILAGTSRVEIASGDKSEHSKGGTDYWIVRTNAQGDKLWDKTLGGAKDEYLSTMLLLPDGNILLGGYSYSNTTGDKSEYSRGLSDYWIVKIDLQGNIIWDKTFGGNRGDYLSSMILLSNEHILLGGRSWSDFSGDKSEALIARDDIWLVEIDAQGNKTWDKTLGGDRVDRLHSMLLLPDHSVLLANYADLIKIDPSNNGSIIWSKKRIAGFAISDMDLTSDGNTLILTGSAKLIKIDSQGNILWDRETPQRRNFSQKLLVLPNDEILVARAGVERIPVGYYSHKLEDYFQLMKLNAQGDQIWSEDLNGIQTPYTAVAHLSPLPNGNFLVGTTARDSFSAFKTNKRGYCLLELSEDPATGLDMDVVLCELLPSKDREHQSS